MSSRPSYLFENFSSKHVIRQKIMEHDDSCLDASTVPTYEEFTKNNTKKYEGKNLNSTSAPEMTFLVTDDEEDSSPETNLSSKFKRPSQRYISSYDPSIIEIDSLSDTLGSINLNKIRTRANNSEQVNNVFSSISNSQIERSEAPIKSIKCVSSSVNSKKDDLDYVKLFDDNQIMTPRSKESQKKKLTVASSIDNQIGNSDIENTNFTLKKFETPNKVTPRKTKPETPINKAKTPSRRYESVLKPVLPTPPRKIETTPKQLEKPYQNKVTPSRKLQSQNKTPSKSGLSTSNASLLKSTILGNTINALSDSDSNGSIEYVSTEDKYAQTDFSPAESERDPICPQSFKYPREPEDSPSLIILDESADTSSRVETCEKHTSVYQSQTEVTSMSKEASSSHFKLNLSSSSSSPSSPVKVSNILDSSSSTDESPSQPKNNSLAPVNVTQRRRNKNLSSTRRSALFEASGIWTKGTKKRVSICGEGLSSAQLKIDETILDESENESDLRSGKIFSLCASKIEEDLNSSNDGNTLPDEPIMTSTQAIVKSDIVVEDSLCEDFQKYETNLSSNNAEVEKKKDTISSESSDDKFEKFLNQVKETKSKAENRPKKALSLKNFLADDSDEENSSSPSREEIPKRKDVTKKKEENIILDTDDENANSGSTTDSDQQLFYIRTTNKLVEKKQTKSNKTPLFKTSPSSLLDDSSSSSKSSASDDEIQLSSDSDSDNEKGSFNKYRDRNLKFKSVNDKALNPFHTPVMNRNKALYESRLVKTQQVTRVREQAKLSFIESLSNVVEHEHLRDPAVSVYRKKFKNKDIKNELLRESYNRFNERAFENRLPKDMKLTWSGRLTATGGFCKNNIVLKTSEIQISTKVCDTPERMRDVLAHEMCHAASFLISGVLDGHGSIWKSWATKVNFAFKLIPKITVTHSYEIKKKFIFKCLGCSHEIHRFSKSIDITKQGCGICHSRFELLYNKPANAKTVSEMNTQSNNQRFDNLINNTESGHPTRAAPSTPSRGLNAFSQFVKDNYSTVKKERGLRHQEVMKELGSQFKQMKS